MLTYSNVIELSLANKGGSFNLSLSGSAQLPQSGFVVGVEKIHQIDVSESGDYDRAELTKWLDFARDRASNVEYAGKRLVIGTWVDNGTFYIDLSEVVDSREQAVQLCKDGDELAYWDIAAQESVSIKVSELPDVFKASTNPPKGMKSSTNPVPYINQPDHALLFEAMELADSSVSTEFENYHFIYRAAAWALENAPSECVKSFDPNNDKD